MRKRRKPTGPRLADDPHGWLVGVLTGKLQPSVKAQRAVTALTGFVYIAGSAQGAGRNRPFDHQAPDDSVCIDTKTQQAGLLDVKHEKPGKQFTAWDAADKRFLPVQLVLDSLTESWYFVPGIPCKTVSLDPLVTAFDPAAPLSPFKIADGSLDDLLVKAEFLAVQEKLRAALSCLLAAKESLMKVIDEEYQRYLTSTAEVLGENPQLMKAVARNANAMRAISRNTEALEVIGSDEDAVRAITKNPDAIDTIASDKDAVRAITRNADAIEAIASDKDAMRAITKKPEAIEAIASDKDALRALAAHEEAMRELLGPELFETWKKTRQP